MAANIYSSSVPATTSINGMGGSMIDGSGTIDPAALNTPVSAISNTSNLYTQASPRRQKRSRSPEDDTDQGPGGGDDDDDPHRRKRGRPPKSKLSDESPTSAFGNQQVTLNSPEQLRTPVSQPETLPQDTKPSPGQTSPPKAVPAKSVLKALPTVRDHTTDQLTPEGDEYVPREYDDDGERKVARTGHPQEGREYKMRTFYVPNRGEKLFMLATECARVLGYRDSYLLFNKNRSLFKIIATQTEKDELIHQEILPYSYRSRQIAIVTAKSMFRQFGARVIEDGRRVKDDYWEAKAKKQGFTEEDMAGDKRPGATKARDAAAALEAVNNESSGLAQADIRYSTAEKPNTLDQLQIHNPNIPIPMIQSELRDYGHLPRQRQDISGPPYVDRTQPSSAADIMHQAVSAVEHNKIINDQREFRGKALEAQWNRKRDPPVTAPLHKVEQSPAVSQSPQMPSSTMMNTNQHPLLQQQNSSQIMSPQRYHTQHTNSHAQSPVRQSISSMRPDFSHQQRSSVYNPGHPSQTSSYGYQHTQPQLWGQPPPHPQPQPQQSPISSQHPALSQYSQSPHAPQPPQIQHHPSQSPGHPQHPQTPQHHHSHSSGSMHGNMAYQNMVSMPGGGPASAYGGLSGQQRSIYAQQGHSGSPPSSQYIQQTTAAQQAGTHSWAPAQPGGQPGAQNWQGYP